MVQASRRKFHYIYKITRVDNGRYYIGMHSTDNLEDEYFGSGKLITASVKKHGKEKHIKEILEYCESRDALKAREKDLVTRELLEDKQCMNIRLGGEGGWDHIPRDVVLKNLSNRNIGWATYNTSEIAKRQSSERMKNHHLNGTIKFVYDNFVGRKHTEETKRRIGAANSKKQTGSNNSQFNSCWVSDAQTTLKIKRDQLDDYIARGYHQGRKIIPL